MIRFLYSKESLYTKFSFSYFLGFLMILLFELDLNIRYFTILMCFFADCLLKYDPDLYW